MIDAVGAIYVRRVSDDRWYVVVEGPDGSRDECGPYRTREHAHERVDAIVSEAVSVLLEDGVPVERDELPDGGGFCVRVKRGRA